MSIDSLDFPRADLVITVSYDAVKVVLYQPGEPEEVHVFGSLAPVDDVREFLDHRCLICGGICLLYGLFDQVTGEQELVGLDDVVAALLEIVMCMPVVSRLEDP